MKKLLIILSFIFFTHSYTHAKNSDDLFNPKMKAFLIVSGYGAAGGALLGFASMAFGQDGKAIARGASLGLYAGMIFGAYIILTHNDYQYQYNKDLDDGGRDYSFNTELRYEDGKERLALKNDNTYKYIDFNVPVLNYRF